MTPTISRKNRTYNPTTRNRKPTFAERIKSDTIDQLELQLNIYKTNFDQKRIKVKRHIKILETEIALRKNKL